MRFFPRMTAASGAMHGKESCVLKPSKMMVTALAVKTITEIALNNNSRNNNDTTAQFELFRKQVPYRVLRNPTRGTRVDLSARLLSMQLKSEMTVGGCLRLFSSVLRFACMYGRWSPNGIVGGYSTGKDTKEAMDLLQADDKQIIYDDIVSTHPPRVRHIVGKGHRNGLSFLPPFYVVS